MKVFRRGNDYFCYLRKGESPIEGIRRHVFDLERKEFLHQTFTLGFNDPFLSTVREIQGEPPMVGIMRSQHIRLSLGISYLTYQQQKEVSMPYSRGTIHIKEIEE